MITTQWQLPNPDIQHHENYYEKDTFHGRIFFVAKFVEIGSPPGPRDGGIYAKQEDVGGDPMALVVKVHNGFQWELVTAMTTTTWFKIAVSLSQAMSNGAKPFGEAPRSDWYLFSVPE
jgi:hypothetical protein